LLNLREADGPRPDQFGAARAERTHLRLYVVVICGEPCDLFLDSGHLLLADRLPAEQPGLERRLVV
jgi:hypothetical protein